MLVALLMVGAFVGCERSVRTPALEEGIILSSDVPVRNSTALLAVELERLRRAEEVEILERKGTEWVRVRTRRGIEGWVEARHVLSKRAFERARALEREMGSLTGHARGRLIGSAAVRLTPGRASEESVLFYAPAGTPVEILRQVRTRRMSDELLPPRYDPSWLRKRSPEAESPPADLWYGVRLPESFLIRVGWVYAPLVELSVPDRLRHLQGEYAFVAWYEVARVEDPVVGSSSHYVTFDTHRTRPVPGTDFERIRLWVWDVEQHQYKIGRREIAHGLFPIAHQQDAARHRFRVRVYDRQTGALQEVDYIVEVSDPTAPRFVVTR